MKAPRSTGLRAGFSNRSHAVGLLICAALGVGCDSLQTRPMLPEGLACDQMRVVGTSLESTLSGSVSGDCIVLGDGTYVGSFVLPEDATITAAAGATVVLRGDGTTNPVLTIRGGTRSTVRGLRIETTVGGGIAIDPGPANLINVSIGATSGAALTATCTRGGPCDGEITVTDSDLGDSQVGLLLSGVKLKMVGGRIHDMAGSSLSSGSGVVATSGATVTLEGVTVENNANVGVLIDGATTRATLSNATVKGNLGRGVWVQNVARQAEETTVSISGGTVSGNKLAGIGVLESAGVSVSNLTVSDTIKAPRGEVASTFEVGDGVALFKNASHVVLDNVLSKNNFRAQLLADEVGVDVVVRGSSEAQGGLYKAVVQRTANTVTLPMGVPLDMPTMPLGVDNAAVSVAP